MASKPKRAIITNTKKKPVTPPKAAKLAKPRRKRQPQRAWWDVLLDFIGNFILLVLASALILGLAHFFRDFFDWLL